MEKGFCHLANMRETERGTLIHTMEIVEIMKIFRVQSIGYSNCTYKFNFLL